MQSSNEASRVKNIRSDIAPSTNATLHVLGIRDGPVTYSVKDEGAVSTASWHAILGDE